MALAGAISMPPPVSAQILAPTPYLSFANSPFSSGGSFSYFHLENFEDLQLNTPGASVDHGTIINNTNSFAIDSVDGDDGVIDGSGALGASIADPTSMAFSFDAESLGGSLPTHVGVVWTDGTPIGQVTFQAFGPAGVFIGSTTVILGDFNFFGTTPEDHFFGVINPGGISRIFITDNNSANALELDHLQYGLAGFSSAAAPEPASLVLLATGLLPVVGAVIRKRRKPKPDQLCENHRHRFNAVAGEPPVQ